MFLRQKRNKSGKVSAQVIDKSNRKYRVMHTIGCSVSKDEVQRLVLEGKSWISNHRERLGMDFTNYRTDVNTVLDGIESLENIGVELLLGRIFNEIEFNAIKEPLFKYLVVSAI